VKMPRPKSLSPLDHPLIWRGLVRGLNTVIGLSGPYVEVHDAIVIGEFCEAFDISLEAVSAQLETYVHASSDAVN
jgi:hypothetical protein